MNIYDRIINILLEARVEMFIQDRLDEARYESGKKVKAGLPKKGGFSPEVKSVIRQNRFEKDNPDISPADSEDARQKKHHETHGKAAVSRAIKARGKRTTP